MNETDLKSIGKRICERRKSLGYTQEMIAEKTDLSIQMISNLERGIKAVKIENLLKLSKILQISTDYILTGKSTGADIDATAKKLSMLSEKDFRLVNMIIDQLKKDENSSN